MNTRPGRLLVLSGPSGVGKTTVADRLLREEGIERVVTATTRAPRPGEVPGVDYHFLTRDEFEEGIREGRFLEHAHVHENLYGTPRDAVEAGLRAGKNLLLNIDVQGAAILRETARDLDTVSVFLLPPSPQVLEERLRGRGTETAGELERRLETARHELERRDEYDHRVVNDILEEACQRILEILRTAPPGEG